MKLCIQSFAKIKPVLRCLNLQYITSHRTSNFVNKKGGSLINCQYQYGDISLRVTLENSAVTINPKAAFPSKINQ